MAKSRTLFFCSACGHEASRWLGRCPACDAWNTFSEAPAPLRTRVPAPRRAGAGPALVRLAEVSGASSERIASGFAEFDAVLGGGIVPGSLVLVGGPPGAGKSTLLLQIAAHLAQDEGPVVYVCGEESAAQTKLRAGRLGASGDLLLFPETDLRVVLEELEKVRPRALIVDSIQTMALPEVESFAGSIAQVRDCAAALMTFAKATDCATFIVGHVTKDGSIAGPRLLEHLVDTVLYFEGDNGADHRILRAHKNRFGSADEICVFAMDERGLHEIRNPSQLFLGGTRATERPSGSCVVASIVGSRPVLVEIQALVGETAYGTPQRLAANIDRARLAMILAVLERRAGMHLGTFDVYASVAGGLRVVEPAADLGIALAVASAFRGVPLPPATAVFGELGLSGEVRPVAQRARRTAEAHKLGFGSVVAPARGAKDATDQTLAVADIASAIARVFD
ncbi:MAG TPA: DNA repair protein RadA [Candidatus Baltobacteraceae bacterium]|nr:DNA repair protein RadA [Candidatus Baltobacteraceae bacterium]